MNALTTEKFMGVKEIAKVFQCAESSVKRTIEKLRPILGEVLTNTQGGYLLNEFQVTEIKKEMEGHHNLDNIVEVKEIKTDKEMHEKAIEVMQWMNNKLTALKAENENLTQKVIADAPKVESFEALQRSDNNMSITECSKHFGLHPKLEVFPFLRSHGYLTSKDLPTQKAIDEGIMIERQQKGNDGVYRGQSVIEGSMLEKWRTIIVPRILS